MQSSLADWYKVIDTTRPEESIFEKRKQAVDEIVTFIVDSSDYNSLATCVAGVARGFEVQSEDAITRDIIKCYQTHLVGFPSTLAENALELRVAVGAALEEILSRSNAQENDTKREAEMFAPFFLSALGLSPAPSEQFLADRISQLKSGAAKLLETNARELRKRQHLDVSDLKNIAKPPDQATWTSFVEELQNVFDQIEQQALVDREELEILWWAQNGISKKLRQQFVDLPPAKAAIYAGLEVAKMAILPPLHNLVAVVEKVVAKGRKPNDIKARQLGQLVDRKQIDMWAQLAPTDKETKYLVGSFPSLFPLSYLGMRLQESRGAAGWEDEFLKRTGISVDQTFTPAQIAQQVFREQIALRTYEDAQD